jgi:leader peptidase (prepilin peptidase)/N-methyltransferase
MADTVMNITMGVMLLFCGVQDALKKKIYLWIIALGAILMGTVLPFSSALPIVERIGGVGIGVCVIIISKATGGKIGMGDGILLCITGLGLGFWGNLELFGFALFFAAIISILLLVFRLVDRKKSIPFVPFLFFAYILLMIVRKGR